MEGLTTTPGRPLTASLGGATVAIQVGLDVYALPAVLRACYQLTDRCYFFLRRETPGTVTVYLQSRSPDQPAQDWLGTLSNELLDQQIREHLAREAGPLRELIAAQAFSEGNLLDENRDDGDYRQDSLGIGRPG